MVKVCTISTSKGGTGKTTLAVALVDFWRRSGKKVAVLDTDPNQSITRWIGKTAEFADIASATTSNELDVVETVQNLAEDADIIVIDTAGFGNQAMIYAVGVADLVLIPVLADEASVFEAIKMRRIVENASALSRRQVPFRTVLNRARNTLVSRHTRRNLEQQGLNPVNVSIGDRSIFQEASYHGASVTALDKRSKAVREIRRLANELAPLLEDDNAA